MDKSNQGAAAQGSDSETLRNLRAARAKLERGWTQVAQARDARGEPVERGAPEAVAWCLLGAIHPKHECVGDTCRVLTSVLGVDRSRFVSWNDAKGRTQAEVLDAIDRAIALASNASAPTAPPETP